jgi:hypothetical protein
MPIARQRSSSPFMASRRGEGSQVGARGQIDAANAGHHDTIR